jgi:hypothetical protein
MHNAFIEDSGEVTDEQLVAQGQGGDEEEK